MRKLEDERFLRVLERYGCCCVDYLLAAEDDGACGLEAHRRALDLAMAECSARVQGGWSWDVGKAAAMLVDPGSILEIPRRFDGLPERELMYYDGPYQDDRIPYWTAFLEPPHGTEPVVIEGQIVRERYGREDFELVNQALFPQGIDALVAYEWSTGWSDYFDMGHEWWGASCWTFYDGAMDRYVVIMASATD
ncbi:MAG: hypothetical protein Q4D06_01840 [Coriobacteriia bacterium]|nr:hypothetical protein [Coriobacteriia bacterium]